MKRSMRSVNVMLQLRLKRSNSNWKKEITVYVSSYIDIIESKMSFTLNKIKKRNERNVSTHSLSPQNIESEVKKALLPKLFADLGLDKAKDVIERVIQITRIGLSRGVYE